MSEKFNDANKTRKNRVIVIGLDGATFNLIQPMIKDGKLPNLEKSARLGVSRKLLSTIHPSSEQAWPSFMTGKNNGKHGVFGYQKRKDGSYETELTTANHVKGPTLWRIMSANDKKVIVINVPMTFPPEPVNGALVSGLGTPSLDSNYTYPQSIKNDIEREIGNYIIEPQKEKSGFVNEDEVLRQFAESAMLMIEKRLALTKYLSNQMDWDFLMVVFSAPDRICHTFWKYIDPKHPQYKESEAEKHGHVIGDIYGKLDEVLGEISETLIDEQTSAFIVSDHGFGPIYKAIYLNKWLEVEGFLTRKSNDIAFRNNFIKTSIRRSVTSLIRLSLVNLNKIPVFDWFKRNAIYKWLPQSYRDKVYASLALGDIDWPKTAAYAIGPWGGIYLNVKGREPDGSVNVGAKYNQVRDEIIERLRDFRDPETNKPIFPQVHRREEVYSGEFLDQAPDIVPVIREDRYQVATIDWRKHDDGLISTLSDDLQFAEGRSGNHNRVGVFISFGKNINQDVELDTAQIIDLAPTILFTLGLPIPSQMDGTVLIDIFAEGFLKDNPTTITDVEVPENPLDIKYTSEENKLVEDQLRRLGYLD